ncbi:hypothetical protein GGP41_008941 [Bipolaris sorokiniana]|uniref:Uncharacterized protein n=1 Tax=Cochliobolus sativus TaxID=45130 RepID=A0A8H5ZH06_COCSA|nr:hypothetical protein GGP41_008941 [Bipolaris sorokiniana]
MKLSAIFLIGLASLAAARDNDSLPRGCDDCKRYFEACMRPPVLPLALSILAASARSARSAASTRTAKFSTNRLSTFGLNSLANIDGTYTMDKFI